MRVFLDERREKKCWAFYMYCGERTSALARIVPKARKGFVVASLSFRPRGSVRAVDMTNKLGWPS
jgi:hypothetical protein